MARPLWLIGFTTSEERTKGHGLTAASASSFWLNWVTNSGDQPPIICVMEFMNCAPSKGMSNIGCFISFMVVRLQSGRIA